MFRLTTRFKPFTVLFQTVLLSLLVFIAPPLAAAPFAYITNSGAAANTVSVIDLATNTVIALPIMGGANPFGVAVTPDGTRVYVTNDGSDTVSVISTATNTVIGLPIAVGDGPQGVAVTPDGLRVYVANFNSNNVSVIDTATNTVIATVAVGTNPHGVAVTPDGTRVYVVNLNSSNVSVISTTTNTVTATVTAGANPIGVAVTPDGTRVYVTNFIFGSGTVSVLSTATNTVTATVTVGSSPFGVAVTPDGTRVYVANAGGSNASVIDTATNTVIATVAVGTNPRGVAVTPDGTRVYVANRSSNNVSVISNGPTPAVTGAPITVGLGPTAFGLFITPGAAAPLPLPPTITNGPPPNGTVGVSYNFAYTSTGSPTFSITAGALPTGLSLSAAGVISVGPPTDAGTFTGTVTASNGTLPNATQNFSITITAAAPPGPAAPIPTFSEWAMIILSVLMVGLAGLHYRKKGGGLWGI